MDIKSTKLKINIKGGSRSDRNKNADKKQIKHFGYLLFMDGKKVYEKPLKWTNAVMEYCRLSTMRKPRKRIKNGKKTQYTQDHSLLRIKVNEKPIF